MSGSSSAPRSDIERSACEQFAIDGHLAGLEAFHRGHIHDTFIGSWSHAATSTRYLHQRLNDNVFNDIPGLMHNVECVTAHLHARATPSEGTPFLTLELIPTRSGDTYHRDADGGFWRTYGYIENTRSYDVCETENHAYEAARIFGRFQELLIDLDPSRLCETIPKFFSSTFRLSQLEGAIRENAAGRVDAAREEIDFVMQRRSMVPVFEDLVATREIPTHVVHGDTKLNNVLFDVGTGQAVCVVDLDTCMPAYSLYDFGDLVRFTAARSAEDETDLSKVGVDLELYRALVHGYLENVSSFLTAREIELMPFAARLVTMTIGIRFLTDYLAGDVYFKTEREHHNLDRCRTQLAMVRDMEDLEPEMLACRTKAG